jgi:3-isopropylmalate/(R)-2-methylmalate dehydratase small subunit
VNLRGRAHRYGDHIDTDVIIPARYCHAVDPAVLGRHCLEDLDPAFVGRVRSGDLLVAGENFGCGSSREHAPVALRGAGVAAVIARSFARIFFRNAINLGLPILVAPDAVEAIRDGDEVEVDLARGTIRVGERTFQAQPFPEALQAIIRDGGLIPHLQRRLGLDAVGTPD